MIKIAICDDDICDIKILRKYIELHHHKHDVTEFISAIPLMSNIYAGNHFDIIFLDIHMPDSDGWKIAKELKQAKIKTYIAMVTAIGEYIFDCFDRVDWFAPKPITMEKVHKILDSIYSKCI